ncbi:MAG: c-type cytochrome [Acidobacteriota bacterium]|nr:c-type cytochrome [Acidobacteriota bacterium]
MRILAASLFLLLPLCAQPPAEGAKKRPEPKNLQVLKIPASELIPTMRSYTAALGVECEHCHVGREFDKDDKHPKLVARHMITMTAEINSKFPDGKIHVTCYTCHRGSLEPRTTAPPKEPAAH